ncbi:alginate O-acetyltransferase [Clostridium sartagoforme]|uniref:Alginate O-acetyltransferase n=1 Tax=Clostridium sartagoforme TaxID=84031 RepID=A0A4S2DJP4_9CLOT|nr:alginate O-acetyltransferase [Clostridium sartagoforme]TGY42437.1 alginate O-acetyltransferase [Clostridium sartagoforme]
MKKIHKVKIILFLGIIAVPLIFMNLKEDVVSEIDNRMLVDFDEIFEDSGKVIYNFESFVNDRIGFRKGMVKSYGRAMDILLDEMVHPNYQYGKDGYVYLKLPETNVDLRFQELFSSFIKDFETYCRDRGIDFLYTLEPSKSTIYPEYLPEGYIRSTENLDYFTGLLDEKGVNYLSNVDILLKAKEEAQVFDPKYDAGHWNETGAIYGISAMIDRLNDLDNRVGSFDINKFEAIPFVNTSLMNSDFPINETTTNYELKEYSLEYIEDYEYEIIRHKDFRYYNHYVNKANPDGTKLLIFAGSYFNNKEKFIAGNFSEIMKIHNYRNVLDYEYYINIYQPDMVLFESTEYTNTGYHYPKKTMENKPLIKNINSYSSLKEDDLVEINQTTFKKSNTNLTTIAIPYEGEDILNAYATINGRILDLQVKRVEDNNYVGFSIINNEIKDIDAFDLYFLSKDEERYGKVELKLMNDE